MLVVTWIWTWFMPCAPHSLWCGAQVATARHDATSDKAQAKRHVSRLAARNALAPHARVRQLGGSQSLTALAQSLAPNRNRKIHDTREPNKTRSQT